MTGETHWYIGIVQTKAKNRNERKRKHAKPLPAFRLIELKFSTNYTPF